MLSSMDRLGRGFFLVAIIVAIGVVVAAFLTAFRQTPPPPTRHYVGLSWAEAGEAGKTLRLFSVTQTANGLSIAAGSWPCSATAVSDGEDFTCGGHVFRYEHTVAFHRLISAGFQFRA